MDFSYGLILVLIGNNLSPKCNDNYFAIKVYILTWTVCKSPGGYICVCVCVMCVRRREDWEL